MGVGKESSFFILVGGDGAHHPHPGLRPHSPRVTPAHPDGLHITGSRAGRARTRAGQVPGQTMQGTTHAQTLDTLHRSALDTRHATPSRSYRRRGGGGRAVCPEKCTISDAIFILIYICIFLRKALDYSDINDII